MSFPLCSRYVWRRTANRPLPKSATSDPRGELSIYGVTIADAGEYVCSVINESTGTVLGRMEVDVRVFDSSADFG